MALGFHNILLLHPGSNAEVQLDLITLKKGEIIIKALNHKLRLQIIRLLQDRSELAVTEIYIKLKIEQSVASQHLATMRRAGIVTTRREGKFIFYSINNKRIEQIYNIAKTLI